MQADHPLRAAARARERGHRKRGGVGGQDAGVRHLGFQALKGFALELQVFDNRFDDEGAVAEDAVLARRARGPGDAVFERARDRAVQAALLHLPGKHRGQPRPRLLQRFGARVGHQHLMARRGGYLGNAAAHRARAEHPERGIRPERGHLTSR